MSQTVKITKIRRRVRKSGNSGKRRRVKKK